MKGPGGRPIKPPQRGDLTPLAYQLWLEAHRQDLSTVDISNMMQTSPKMKPSTLGNYKRGAAQMPLNAAEEMARVLGLEIVLAVRRAP